MVKANPKKKDEIPRVFLPKLLKGGKVPPDCRPKVTCRKCKGRGRIPSGEPIAIVRERARRHGKPGWAELGRVGATRVCSCCHGLGWHYRKKSAKVGNGLGNVSKPFQISTSNPQTKKVVDQHRAGVKKLQTEQRRKGYRNERYVDRK